MEADSSVSSVSSVPSVSSSRVALPQAPIYHVLRSPASFPIFSMEATARSSKSKSLGLLLIIALVVLLVVIDMKRRSAEAELQKLSMQLEQVTGGNQQQNREAAREIVEKVRELYALPE